MVFRTFLSSNSLESGRWTKSENSLTSKNLLKILAWNLSMFSRKYHSVVYRNLGDNGHIFFWIFTQFSNKKKEIY
jgi:hypothetical protein